MTGYTIQDDGEQLDEEKASSDGVDACHKQMVALLNKLTREKFDRITRQILAIEFGSRPLLKQMI